MKEWIKPNISNLQVNQTTFDDAVTLAEKEWQCLRCPFHMDSKEGIKDHVESVHKEKPKEGVNYKQATAFLS